ncbi:ABC-2 family transporter protein [Haploplasma axanthum]|uniref:ABC-2 family transporter protein n=1 Tax=Haploplasma axanthum TaxID=29552 RepID=A0A449BE92_HAPAX|nr:ABC-2 family transporter protein [Haploplasma axanthum]
MISIYVQQFQTFKAKIGLLIYLCLLILNFVIFLPFDVPKYDLFFNTTYYIETYTTLSYELLKIIVVMGLIALIYDHNKNYHNNLTCFKSRSYVILNKILIYTFIILINGVVIVTLKLSVLRLFRFNDLVTPNTMEMFETLILDCFVILFIGLLIVRKKTKISIFLIAIIYFILNIYYQNSTSIILFYLFPVHGQKYYNYKNSECYQILYIIILIFLNFVKYNNEDI